jgi:plastocyanin
MHAARKISLLARLWIGIAVAAAPLAAAAAEAKDKPSEPGPTAAEFARLQREVAEQRQLIMQMLQIEQQRYDLLLRLIQTGGGGQAAPGTTVPPNPAIPPVGGAPAEPARGGGEHEHGGPTATATVSGRVQARAGALKDTYVYVDQVRGAPARGHTLEIKQKDKQFSPQVAVVQRGTNVVFPNFDPVFHNVFSPSGKNTFDLGSYRAGDEARSVVLTTPGVVEVFCNIHSRMNATILVVPSPLYTKVAADGTFKLDNVPAGARRLVAWSPSAKPAALKVDVTPSGAQANFTLDYEGAAAHLNKLGQPYGSYKD